MYPNIKLDITSLYLYSHINSWASLPSVGKVSACNMGDVGLIPELRRSPAEGKGYPLQYSGLENFMDCIVHGVAKNLRIKYI